MFSSSELEKIKAPQLASARKLRMAQGLSQTALAELIGVKQPTLAGWETVVEGSAMAISEIQLREYFSQLKTSASQFCEALPESVTVISLSRKSLLMLIQSFGDLTEGDLTEGNPLEAKSNAD